MTVLFALALDAIQQTAPGITPKSAFVNPRIVTGAAALVTASVLLLLYVYRRRLFILWWIGGWLLLTASMFLAARPYANQQLGWMAYGSSQFLGILSALAFVIAADAYRHRPLLRREYGLVLLPVAIWFTLAPVALNTKAVFAPGHLLMAGALAAAGAAHLFLLREVRMLGAALVGITLIVLASVHVWVAAMVDQPAAPNAGAAFFTIAVIILVTALGMQLMTFEDMTYELRRTNSRLESAQSDLRQLVITDPLTGCRNRRFFHEVIGRELQRHRRYASPLSILFIDIDRFKVINDTLGHETGDRVLRQVAAFLLRNIREADYVFRWGGDEFLVLISCEEEEAKQRGRQLQESFAASPELSALPAGVGLSVGSAEIPATARDAMPYVQIADEQMYDNKKRTR
jgi:diguanylate cyclase (GGDEF)-like protein